MCRLFPLKVGRAYGHWAALVLGLGLFAPLVGCNKAPPQKLAPPPPVVTVALPVMEDVTEDMRFTGTTRATATVSIRARVNGYLKSVDFTDGAMVEKDQLLFVIEQDPFLAALTSAKAALKKAEASLRLAQAEVKRTTPLVRRGALPEAELDTKSANQGTAEADVLSAQAALRQAELNLSYTEVRAPMKGRIGRHLVDVGNLVQGEMTALTTLDSYDPIHVYFSVGQDDVERFVTERERRKAENPGQNVLQPLELGFDSDDGFPYRGHLDYTDTGLDPSTSTRMLRGIFDNPDLKLIPGVFARVRVPVGKTEPRLMITERAISSDQRGEFLLVVNDKNEVEYRKATFGALRNGKRVIEEGAVAGERIVVNGLQRARPGAVVNPVFEKPAAAADKVTAGDKSADKVAGSGVRVSANPEPAGGARAASAAPVAATAPNSAAASNAAATPSAGQAPAKSAAVTNTRAGG